MTQANLKTQVKHTIGRLAFFRRRLIWKIILIFWLTTIATILANIIITKELVLVEYKIDQLRSKMLVLAKESVALYESDGKPALREWLKELREEEEIRVVLLDEKWHPIVLPRRRHHHDHDDDWDDDDQDEAHHDEHSDKATFKIKRKGMPERFLETMDQNIVSPSGQSYTLRLLPSRYLKEKFTSPEMLHGSRLAATFIIIFIGSWWLARSVSRPVNILRNASEKMADGNLEQRVGSDIGKRHDELGQLASAFDHMAEKIEGLLENQRQLFSDISHEIRTPLTRQKLAIELVRANGDAGNYLEKIEQQNQVIEHLVDQLLTVIKLDTRRNSKSVNDPIDLKLLVEEVVQSAEIDANAKSIVLDCDFQGQLNFTGNAELIKRAIENLLMNAIKYSPANSSIGIYGQGVDKEISLSIRDEGPGIPEQDLQKALEPFYRTDKSRTQSTGGYGLGLAIVKRVADQHKAKITLHNREEGGLEAKLVFPAGD